MCSATARTSAFPSATWERGASALRGAEPAGETPALPHVLHPTDAFVIRLLASGASKRFVVMNVAGAVATDAVAHERTHDRGVAAEVHRRRRRVDCRIHVAWRRNRVSPR